MTQGDMPQPEVLVWDAVVGSASCCLKKPICILTVVVCFFVSCSDAPPVNGKLVMKRVGVQELDQRFYVMAETFNEQHEHYENMVRHIRNVQQIYGCNSNDTLALTECVMKIREEHGKM